MKSVFDKGSMCIRAPARCHGFCCARAELCRDLYLPWSPSAALAGLLFFNGQPKAAEIFEFPLNLGALKPDEVVSVLEQHGGNHE